VMAAVLLCLATTCGASAHLNEFDLSLREEFVRIPLPSEARWPMLAATTYRPKGDKRNTAFFEEFLPRVNARRASSGLEQVVGPMAALVIQVDHGNGLPYLAELALTGPYRYQECWINATHRLYLLKGGETVWVDGPLTRAVREGGICYLDEVVEARKDVTVVLHPLTDTRRTLMIDRTGEELVAPSGFMLVASYNPGYQNVLKRLKPSTRQRFLSISFDFPVSEIEIAVVASESRLEPGRVAPLVRLAGHIRKLSGMDLEEGVSTRLLIYAATLMAGGMSVEQALEAAVIEPLSDEPDVQQALRDLAAKGAAPKGFILALALPQAWSETLSERERVMIIPSTKI